MGDNRSNRTGSMAMTSSSNPSRRRTSLWFFVAVVQSLVGKPRSGAFALDISLKSFSCDETLPIFATDLYMSCKGKSQCTLGDQSDLFGIFTYQDLYEVLNGTVYVDAEISLVSYKYSVVSGEKLNLCALESQNNNCPGNGNYKFDVKFSLPNVDDSWSWFSTGYDHKGELVLYASQRTKVLVGYCDLVFNVDVTKTRNRNPPSALIAGVSSLVLSFLALLLCCCWLDYYKYLSCGKLDSRDFATYHDDVVKNNSLKDDEYGSDLLRQRSARKVAGSPLPQDWVSVGNNDRAVSPSATSQHRLPPGWMKVNDPSTGRLYYANPATGESSWEPPLYDPNSSDDSSQASGDHQAPLNRVDSYPGPPPSDDAGSVATPVRGGASPSRVASLRSVASAGRTTSPSRVAISPSRVAISPSRAVGGADSVVSTRRSVSPTRNGWIKVRDPLSGRLYYANPTTGESSWESPFVTSGGSIVQAPARSTVSVAASPDRSHASSASPFARWFGAARRQQSPQRTTPAGWVKVKDPATNREYYANPATGEVSWHPPTQAMI